ncbi:MAG: hypothetical protein LBD42_00105 [Desulfovibrio sp.]|jgi:hypothetical protein|nr:hypothetical protein [Desulfovibrio sp.]
MTAHSEQSIPSVLSTLQAEVPSEASPMLQFLIRYARLIVIGILCSIAAIAGYWLYTWQTDRQTGAAARELGSILIVSDAGQRLNKLETYLVSAPQSMRNTALFAVMESARQLQDYPKLYAVWKDIGEIDPVLRVPAGFGMASALAAQNKYMEAVAVLEGVSAYTNRRETFAVNSQIIAYAEASGDYARALAACGVLLESPQAAGEVTFWTQKKAELERKQAESGKTPGSQTP